MFKVPFYVKIIIYLVINVFLVFWFFHDFNFKQKRKQYFLGNRYLAEFNFIALEDTFQTLGQCKY